MQMTNELPEGYEVVEISDGCGGYEYQVQKIDDDDGFDRSRLYTMSDERVNEIHKKIKEDFDWCNDSGYSDVFDYECCDDNHPCICS